METAVKLDRVSTIMRERLAAARRMAKAVAEGRFPEAQRSQREFEVADAELQRVQAQLLDGAAPQAGEG